MCEIYAATHTVAAGLAWISAKCRAEYTVDLRVKPELEVVLDLVHKGLRGVGVLIATLQDAPTREELAPTFVIGPDECMEWISSVQSSFGTLMEIIVMMMLGGVKSLANDVQPHTPKFDH